MIVKKYEVNASGYVFDVIARDKQEAAQKAEEELESVGKSYGRLTLKPYFDHDIFPPYAFLKED